MVKDCKNPIFFKFFCLIAMICFVGITEMRSDLSALCLKAGLKKLPTVLLVTDAQVVDETLLGPINDFLAAGEIPGLFSDDEIDNVVQAVRNEVIKTAL